ncbi:unnamed protein product, partial [Hymenolepis diminuta]
MEEYLERLPQVGKSAVKTSDEEDEERTTTEEAITHLTEKSPQDRQAVEKSYQLISEVISESQKDSEMKSQEKELIDEETPIEEKAIEN